MNHLKLESIVNDTLSLHVSDLDGGEIGTPEYLRLNFKPVSVNDNDRNLSKPARRNLSLKRCQNAAPNVRDCKKLFKITHLEFNGMRRHRSNLKKNSTSKITRREQIREMNRKGLCTSVGFLVYKGLCLRVISLISPVGGDSDLLACRDHSC